MIVKVAHVEGDFELMDENGDSYVTRMEYRAYFEGIESEQTLTSRKVKIFRKPPSSEAFLFH